MSVFLISRFDHDAASAVEDVKLRKLDFDLLRFAKAQVRRPIVRCFAWPHNPESVDLVPILFSYTKMAMGRQFDLPYTVEQWDDTDSHVEELIALTGDYRVARAAFEEAVKRRPGRIVTLRQKTRLLADSRRS